MNKTKMTAREVESSIVKQLLDETTTEELNKIDKQMSKQTAVEWLVEELNQKIHIIPMDKWNMIRDIVQQAKEMEKEQIIDAWDNGMKSDNGHFGTKEQYYNETFKNK